VRHRLPLMLPSEDLLLLVPAGHRFIQI